MRCRKGPPSQCNRQETMALGYNPLDEGPTGLFMLDTCDQIQSGTKE